MENKKYIIDPVLNEILIEDDLINDLINTKEFKRLQRIAHLGFTDFIYPSANYTRYLHSLGVYELARRALEYLKPNINYENKMAILAAALLHDIGHGIFSHSFETISKVKHENYSIRIISTIGTEVNLILQKYDKSILEQIIKILNGKHELKWINNLISSEIDVDRIDYLLRDSYFVGMQYAKIDFNWLFKNMVIFNNELVFNYEALPTIENIVLARMNMNKNVYQSLKNLASEKQFKWFFERIKFLNDNSKLNLKYDLLLRPMYFKTLTLEDFYKLDDWFFLSELRKIVENENDIVLLKLAKNIYEKKLPKIYKSEKEVNLLKKNSFIQKEAYSIIESGKDFNFLYTEKKNEAKILTSNNKVLPLRDVSSIIKRESSSINFIWEVGVSL